MKILERYGAVVVLRCPARFDADSIRDFTRDFDDLCRLGARFASVVDTTCIDELPGPVERKLLLAWMNDPQVQARQKVLNVGSSTVVTNAPVRAMMTALHWLWTAPTPQHAARDVSEALDWCFAQLAAASVQTDLPASLIRQRVLAAAAVRRPSMRL